MARMTVCISCNGSGLVHGLGAYKPIKCVTCKSMGRIRYSLVQEFNKGRKASTERRQRQLKQLGIIDKRVKANESKRDIETGC